MRKPTAFAFVMSAVMSASAASAGCLDPFINYYDDNLSGNACSVQQPTWPLTVATSTPDWPDPDWPEPWDIMVTIPSSEGPWERDPMLLKWPYHYAGEASAFTDSGWPFPYEDIPGILVRLGYRLPGRYVEGVTIALPSRQIPITGFHYSVLAGSGVPAGVFPEEKPWPIYTED